MLKKLLNIEKCRLYTTLLKSNNFYYIEKSANKSLKRTRLRSGYLFQCSLPRPLNSTFGTNKMINHTSKYAELTDDQFKTIGKIVIEWSNIEFLQKLILSRLLFTNEFLSRSFTDQMSAVKVQESINEALDIQLQRYQGKLIPEKVIENIRSLNKKVTEVRGKRNKFAHFCWSRSNDEEIFGTNFSGGIPDSKKYRRGVVTLNRKEMENLYKETYDLVDKLSEIYESLPEIKEEEIIKNIKAEQNASHGLREQPRNL